MTKIWSWSLAMSSMFSTCLSWVSIFRCRNGWCFIQVFAQILLLLLSLAPFRLGVRSCGPVHTYKKNCFRIFNYVMETTGAADSTANTLFWLRTPFWCSSSCSPVGEVSGRATGSASSSWRCQASCPSARQEWSPHQLGSSLRSSSS